MTDTPQDEVLTDAEKQAAAKDIGLFDALQVGEGWTNEQAIEELAWFKRHWLATEIEHHRSSPSSAVPDVVREWENPPAFGFEGQELVWMNDIGDRMAAALVAQAKTIEGLAKQNDDLAGFLAEHDRNFAALKELRREALVEVERLTGERFAAQQAILTEGMARNTAEASLETARGALARIEKWFGEFPPTGKYWDEDRTKPTSYSAEYGSNGERNFMRAIAREDLAALPAPPITKIKGEG